jgi:hypothetical protein
VDEFDLSVASLVLQPDQFDQTHLGNHEALAGASARAWSGPAVSGSDNEAGDDRQRQRNFEPHRGTLAEAANHVHCSADLLDIRADHIHANAPPGNIGDGLGRGKAGLEDQIQRFPVAQLSSLFGGKQSFVNGFLFDPRHVDACAVVADFYVDLAALVVGPQGKRPLGCLARAGAHIRRLDAVVAGVPNQMDQGVLNGFDNGSIQLRVRALHLQPDLLTKSDGHIPHHPGQLVPDRADGLHPRLHHAFL